MRENASEKENDVSVVKEKEKPQGEGQLEWRLHHADGILGEDQEVERGPRVLPGQNHGNRGGMIDVKEKRPGKLDRGARKSRENSAANLPARATRLKELPVRKMYWKNEPGLFREVSHLNSRKSRRNSKKVEKILALQEKIDLRAKKMEVHLSHTRNELEMPVLLQSKNGLRNGSKEIRSAWKG